MTDYIILQRDESDPDPELLQQWIQRPLFVTASSARRALAAANLEEEGERTCGDGNVLSSTVTVSTMTTKVTIG